MYDQEVAAREERQKVVENKKLKGRSRAEIGLKEFIETEIRSTVMGIGITITESVIAKVIGARSNGMFMTGTDKKSEWVARIRTTLYDGRPSEKTFDMKDE